MWVSELGSQLIKKIPNTSRKTKSKENIKDLEADGPSFQQVSCFNCTSVKVNNTNFMHEKLNYA